MHTIKKSTYWVIWPYQGNMAMVAIIPRQAVSVLPQTGHFAQSPRYATRKGGVVRQTS